MTVLGRILCAERLSRNSVTLCESERREPVSSVVLSSPGTRARAAKSLMFVKHVVRNALVGSVSNVSKKKSCRKRRSARYAVQNSLGGLDRKPRRSSESVRRVVLHVVAGPVWKVIPGESRNASRRSHGALLSQLLHSPVRSLMLLPHQPNQFGGRKHMVGLKMVL
jgi:hypothetical protein